MVKVRKGREKVKGTGNGRTIDQSVWNSYILQRSSLPAGAPFIQIGTLKLQSLNRLLFSLVLMGFILTLGTAGYMFIENWILTDALYMTVITIGTVGFKETHPLSHEGQRFFSSWSVSAVLGTSWGTSVVT